jgi:hypothetical protein
MDVLTVLANGDDEEKLKQFLTYCDVLSGFGNPPVPASFL